MGLIGSRVVVLQGVSALREFILVNDWYQKRQREWDKMREGTEAVERRDVKR